MQQLRLLANVVNFQFFAPHFTRNDFSSSNSTYFSTHVAFKSTACKRLSVSRNQLMHSTFNFNKLVRRETPYNSKSPRIMCGFNENVGIHHSLTTVQLMIADNWHVAVNEPVNIFLQISVRFDDSLQLGVDIGISSANCRRSLSGSVLRLDAFECRTKHHDMIVIEHVSHPSCLFQHNLRLLLLRIIHQTLQFLSYVIDLIRSYERY